MPLSILQPTFLRYPHGGMDEHASQRIAKCVAAADILGAPRFGLDAMFAAALTLEAIAEKLTEAKNG